MRAGGATTLVMVLVAAGIPLWSEVFGTPEARAQNTVTLQPATGGKPSVPTRLTAEAGNTSATLSWTPGNDGGAAITKWEFRQKAGEGPYGQWQDICSDCPSQTSHTVASLTNGTAYTFQVRAVNNVGNGTAASTTVTPLAALTVSGITTTGAKLTISDYTGSWYYKYITPRGGNCSSVVSGTSANLSGLQAGTGYAFRAYSDASCGSMLSTPTGFTTLPPAPAAPTLSVALGKILVRWVPGFVRGATKYQMQYRATGYDYSSEREITYGGQPMDHEISTSGTLLYTVRFRAGNAGGWGPWSNETSKAAVCSGCSSPPTPGKVAGVSATSGDAYLDVNWTAQTGPTDYEVQWKSGQQDWDEGADGRNAIVVGQSSYRISGLSNGASYTIRVAAFNGGGTGKWSDLVTATPATGAGLPSSASDAASPQATTLSVADARAAEPRSGGSAATLDFVVTLNPAASGTVTVDYATSDDTATAGADYTATSGTLTFAMGESSKTVSVPVLSDSHSEGNETMKLTLSNVNGIAEISDGEATGTITTPTILVSVADATVAEPGAGGSATLDFAVTLSRPPYLSAGKVTVDYATSDDTATAGADYTTTSGTLTFAMGESSKTVSVPVLPDSHNEGNETMRLILSNVKATAVIGDAGINDGEATGTITNAGPIPQAWISRFGRTVADQVLDAVDTRLRSTPRPGSEVMLAGIPMGDGGGQEAQGLAVATLTDQELLANSSFALTSRTGGGGLLSLWGRGAVTSFAGSEGDLSLDGEVTTWMVGTDWSWGKQPDSEASRTTAGLLLSRSAGDGDYAGTGTGDVDTTLTGVFPWARHRFTDRLEAWGAAGYGQGDLEVTPKQPGTGKDGAVIKTDLNLGLAAVGLRGTLLDGGSDGLTLTGKTDAMAVWTTSGSGSGTDGGKLESAQATVTRLGLGVEAQRPIPLGNPDSGSGAVLTPSLAVGLRHDGGDAETGFGLDLGGGIVLSHPQRGLQAELWGRGLLSHAAEGFRDRGFSGSLSWQQQPDSDLGAALSLTQTMGGSSSGGADALLSRVTLEGMAANDTSSGNDDLKNRRMGFKFSYGFPAFGDRFTLTPELGLGLYDSGRDYRIGWRLTRPDDGKSGESVVFSFDVTRRENTNNDGTAPDHGVQLEVNTRF